LVGKFVQIILHVALKLVIFKLEPVKQQLLVEQFFVIQQALVKQLVME